MKRLTATEAARRFSDVLDSVERDRETFVIERHGREVARIGPPEHANGKRVKEILRAHPPDEEWARELAELRASQMTEERDWNV